MMKLCVFLAFLAVASASVDVAFAPQDMLNDLSVAVEHRFGLFSAHFEKDYENVEATAKAALAFAANDEIIREHNAGNSTFTLGHNEFSDLTWDEFKAIYVTGMAANPNLRREKNIDLSLLTAPRAASVDWVTKGAVTPIKNQGQCGSCWAFSTTGSTEGAFQIAGNKLTSFSEQDLVDCASSFGNQGCNGGLMDNGFKYIEKFGLATEANYPYTGKTDKCDKSKQRQDVVTVTGFTDVPTKSSTSLQAAVTKGPVSVAIEADKSAFQLYKSGVFTSATCGTQLDHGVLVVGYGTGTPASSDVEADLPYWRVKNSWGTTWGDSGYIYIESGKNLCGISQQPSFPTGAKKATPAPPSPSPPPPGPLPKGCKPKEIMPCGSGIFNRPVEKDINGKKYCCPKDAPTPPAPPTPPSPGPSPAPAGSHYEDPNTTGGCQAGEEAVQIQGVAGKFCSPSCTSGACPTDVPAGVTAKPQCALKSPAGAKYCALICSPTTDEASLRAGDAQCGTNASCKSISGTGICTYDK